MLKSWKQIFQFKSAIGIKAVQFFRRKKNVTRVTRTWQRKSEIKSTAGKKKKKEKYKFETKE